MIKTKRNQVFDNKKIGNVLKKLAKLPKKEKTEFSLKETIIRLKDKLNRALNQGYTYEDLSSILSEQEIYVSVNMLKQYLREANNLPELSSSDDSSSSSQQEQEDDNPVTESTGNSTTESLQKEHNSDSSDNGLDSKTSVKSKAENKNKQQKSQTKEQTSSVNKDSVLSGYSDDLSSDFNQY